MSLPPAVIFDWDNTLIDTFPLLMAGANLVRERLGHPLWSEAEARANIRLAGRDAFPRLYGDRWQEAEEIFYTHVRAHHLDGLRVMPGAGELIEALHAAGVKLGILSNKRGDILRREVDHLGWARFFHTVHGPDDVGHVGKPHPQGLLETMRGMQVPGAVQAQVWYVGDTENDLRTAQAAGVVPVYIENDPMSDPTEIQNLKPAYSFADCVECLDYLRGLVDSAGN